MASMAQNKNTAGSDDEGGEDGEDSDGDEPPPLESASGSA